MRLLGLIPSISKQAKPNKHISLTQCLNDTQPMTGASVDKVSECEPDIASPCQSSPHPHPPLPTPMGLIMERNKVMEGVTVSLGAALLPAMFEPQAENGAWGLPAWGSLLFSSGWRNQSWGSPLPLPAFSSSGAQEVNGPGSSQQDKSPGHGGSSHTQRSHRPGSALLGRKIESQP